MKQFSVSIVGCGARGRLYAKLMSQRPEQFKLIAAADVIADRAAVVAGMGENVQVFASAEAFFEAGVASDLIVVSTQDAQHFGHCQAALNQGANVLLEKPISPVLDHVLELERSANEKNLRVVVCHVLRYAPLYRRIREILDSGVLGEVVAIHAHEGVEPYHQAHSFVRGHWSVTEKSAPMILAKSCHDMDLLVWFAGGKGVKVASSGGISHFRKESAPAGAPKRCHEGCPVAATCLYNANRYLGDKKGWLGMVHPSGAIPDVALPETREWLENSPWGRCVYHCDNTAVDHQSVSIGFDNGVTATFSMTAFDFGRNLEIYGTKGLLRAGEIMKRLTSHDIIIEPHGGEMIRESISTDNAGYDGHAGGDGALIADLYAQLIGDGDGATSLAASVESHRLAFAAEASRLE